MSLKWVDVLEIAIQLAESKPEVDPRYVNFVDLHKWVLAFFDPGGLNGFKHLLATAGRIITELRQCQHP